jgi:tetratricopeptide (TPR) repeat protein
MSQQQKTDFKAIQQRISSGHFTDAINRCEVLLKDIQSADSLSQQECLYLMAVAFRLNKDYSSAIAQLQNILSINAEHSRALQELGYNYRALNEDRLALEHFYKATQANPALLSSWQALLPYYQAREQLQATELCKSQIKKLSDLPRPILAATDLFYDGKIDAAENLCLQYLQQNKHSLPALMLLAEIASKLRAISEAEFILETCVELAPNNAEAMYSLFKVYSKLGKFEAALSLSNKLLNINADNTFYKVAKATSLVSLGEIEDAIAIYHSVIDNEQADANLYLLLGHALKTKGDKQASIKAYQQAYILSPAFGDAYWSLANTKTYEFSNDEIQKMLDAAKAQKTSSNDKIHLEFALGKAFEDKRLYKASFEHYEKGNAIKRTEIKYSSTNHNLFIDNLIKTFTPSLVSSLEGVGHQDPSPIFIVGLPRAGSTLLEQILASHSQVDGTMELHEILGLAANLSKKRQNLKAYPHNMPDIPKDRFKLFGEKFIADTQIYRQGAAYFIDKMPNNFMHIGLIKSILPQAKIIDARRSPMACCFSGFKQLFGDGQEFSYALDDIAQYYQAYLRLMNHWHEVYPNQILTVHHEDVVSDLESQVKLILNYCNLPFEEACLSFYENKRAVKTPSAEQVRQPIYTSGLEQWKHYEEYLTPLKQIFK